MLSNCSSGCVRKCGARSWRGVQFDLRPERSFRSRRWPLPAPLLKPIITGTRVITRITVMSRITLRTDAPLRRGRSVLARVLGHRGRRQQRAHALFGRRRRAQASRLDHQGDDALSAVRAARQGRDDAPDADSGLRARRGAGAFEARRRARRHDQRRGRDQGGRDPLGQRRGGGDRRGDRPRRGTRSPK